MADAQGPHAQLIMQTFLPDGRMELEAALSLLDEDVRLRAPDGPRMVVFRSDSLTIDIAIDDDRLTGQIIPAGAGEVTMMTIEGVAGEATADEMGCFVLSPPAPGPTRFRCRIDGSEVFTDWLRL